MLDKIILVERSLFDILTLFLTTGNLEIAGLRISLNNLSSMPVNLEYDNDWKVWVDNGRIYWKKRQLRFVPPLNVSGKVLQITIKTTASKVTLVSDSEIHVEIDNSPVDILLRPE